MFGRGAGRLAGHRGTPEPGHAALAWGHVHVRASGTPRSVPGRSRVCLAGAPTLAFHP